VKPKIKRTIVKRVDVSRPAVYGSALLALALSAAANAASVTYSITTIAPVDTEHTRSGDNFRLSGSQFLNSNGQVAGFANRYGGGSSMIGRTAWLYDGVSTINSGLTDSEHTRSSDGYRYSVIQKLTDSGQVGGYSNRYSAAAGTLGRTAWVYSGSSTVNIGLTDTLHTRDTDGYRFSTLQFMNQAGNVAGYSKSYKPGGDLLGRTAWLYNGTATVNIGLIDAEHTGAANERYSSAQAMNSPGRVLGYSTRYDAAGADLGRTAWLYNGSTTANIGMTDVEHTRSTDNYRYSSGQFLNDAGQAVGFASRYDAGGSHIGNSAWFYDGSTTANISLSDAEHTRSSDNYRFSSATFLNQSGDVAGYAERYDVSGSNTGRSVWLYNGGSTVRVGLIDAEHTRSTDGYRYADVQQLNSAGDTIGYATRYGSGGGTVGRSAWLYSGTSTTRLGLISAEHTRSTDGYKYSNAQSLGESGNVIGYSERYAAAGGSLGRSAWFFDGIASADISLTDVGHTRSADGYRFSYAQFMNGADQAAGYAYRYDAGGAFEGQSAWFFDGAVTLHLTRCHSVQTAMHPAQFHIWVMTVCCWAAIPCSTKRIIISVTERSGTPRKRAYLISVFWWMKVLPPRTGICLPPRSWPTCSNLLLVRAYWPTCHQAVLPTC